MWWMALAIQPLCTAVHADAPQEYFAVGDIRVEGLQRLSAGTVLNSLPVNIGDHLDGRRLREAIRALYATGFFRDVELRRDGDTLLVVVSERPSIARFEIKGNKDIKTADLEKNLRKVGLAYGKTFDRAVLEDVEQFLTDQYFSRGKYGVRIDAKVTNLPGNQVGLVIDIHEGKRSKIEQINLVGITRFKPKEVLHTFDLKTPNWLSWYTQDDRYSRETLTGDEERLRSYYMDRGYANFQIESTQVAIAPEMDDMYITVNVSEGDAFKISQIKLAGTMVVPEAQLHKLLALKPGDTYSRKAVTKSQESMIYRLGAAGYAFSKIDPVLTADKEKKTVSITFFIEPGNRIYVRHINFNNVSHIEDQTLRREMRQLEGGVLSNSAVERSKQRLQRLPYVEKVEVEIKPVPGSGDLADVDFNIKEGLWGQAGGGLGYSQTQSFSVNVDAALNNFLGTGDRVAVQANVNRYNKAFVLAQTDPYTTIDGVSRTLSLTYREGTRFVTASSNLSTEQLSAGSSWAYPITEYQTVQAGVSANEARLLTTRGFSSLESIDWVKSNGNTFFSRDFEPTVQYYYYGTRFDTYEGTAGWAFDSLNRSLFPDRGLRGSLSGRITLPGSDVNYYTLNSDFLQYVPLWRDYVLSVHGAVNYGSPLGSTTSLPPYLNYFAGGVDSVRGYRDSTLGPRDNIGNGNPYGGNLRIVGNVEVIFPVPEKLKSVFRASWFYDIGNVFQTGSKVEFKGVDKYTPVEYYFTDWSDLKRSTGVALQWLAPLGFFRLSFGIPLNARRGDLVNYGDSTERIQFSVGQAFSQIF
jgi:outer membrane protein insertion porin family